MKLFDIVAGKVVIHSDALGIPCFKRVWNTYKDKDTATNYISYIVLKNKYDSPYVLSMSEQDIEPRLKKELFGDENYKLPVEIIECEKDYLRFIDTLTLRLLRNSRRKLDSISDYYEQSLGEELDETKVMKILSGIKTLGDVVKSIDTLENSVRAEEISTSKIKGGAEINPFELPG